MLARQRTNNSRRLITNLKTDHFSVSRMLAPSAQEKPRVLVLFHSVYGHVYEMAKEVAAGVAEAGVEVDLRRVKETQTNEVLEKKGGLAFYKKIQQEVKELTHANDIGNYDGVIVGFPTRYGLPTPQIAEFFDATGKTWLEGKLVGRVGSVFTSTASQHGANEVTLRNFQTLMLHMGMAVVGLPYAYEPMLKLDQMLGGTPLAGGRGERQPDKLELEGAKYQGKYVGTIVKTMHAGRKHLV